MLLNGSETLCIYLFDRKIFTYIYTWHAFWGMCKIKWSLILVYGVWLSVYLDFMFKQSWIIETQRENRTTSHYIVQTLNALWQRKINVLSKEIFFKSQWHTDVLNIYIYIRSWKLGAHIWLRRCLFIQFRYLLLKIDLRSSMRGEHRWEMLVSCRWFFYGQKFLFEKLKFMDINCFYVDNHIIGKFMPLKFVWNQ